MYGLQEDIVKEHAEILDEKVCCYMCFVAIRKTNNFLAMNFKTSAMIYV